MAKEIKITCDGCGVLKKQTNRWWTVAMGLMYGEFNVQPIDQPLQPMFIIAPLSSDLSHSIPRMESVKDFCGEQCAMSYLSGQMGKVGQ